MSTKWCNLRKKNINIISNSLIYLIWVYIPVWSVFHSRMVWLTCAPDLLNQRYTHNVFELFMAARFDDDRYNIIIFVCGICLPSILINVPFPFMGLSDYAINIFNVHLHIMYKNTKFSSSLNSQNYKICNTYIQMRSCDAAYNKL